MDRPDDIPDRMNDKIRLVELDFVIALGRDHELAY